MRSKLYNEILEETQEGAEEKVRKYAEDLIQGYVPEEVWYVDIPNHQNIGADSPFVSIGQFETKEEAILYMRENIDSEITDDGFLRILSHS